MNYQKSPNTGQRLMLIVLLSVKVTGKQFYSKYITQTRPSGSCVKWLMCSLKCLKQYGENFWEFKKNCTCRSDMMKSKHVNLLQNKMYLFNDFFFFKSGFLKIFVVSTSFCLQRLSNPLSILCTCIIFMVCFPKSHQMFSCLDYFNLYPLFH